MFKPGLFVTGTASGVGQSTVCAWLLNQLAADYWQPVQAGLPGPANRLLQSLSGLPADHFHPATYNLVESIAPHESSKRMGIAIDPVRFAMPVTPRPLIVEGAGGLLTPLSGKFLMIDLMLKLGLPIVLVCHSQQSTINDTLLNLYALQSRHLPVLGVVMNGRLNPGAKEAIETYGRVRVLAEIPELPSIGPDRLRLIHPTVAFANWADDIAGVRAA
jgi:dethiobiotin synthase